MPPPAQSVASIEPAARQRTPPSKLLTGKSPPSPPSLHTPHSSAAPDDLVSIHRDCVAGRTAPQGKAFTGALSPPSYIPYRICNVAGYGEDLAPAKDFGSVLTGVFTSFGGRLPPPKSKP